MSVFLGHPPKVIYIDAYNPPNVEVIAALSRHVGDIERFASDADSSFLSLRIR